MADERKPQQNGDNTLDTPAEKAADTPAEKTADKPAEAEQPLSAEDALQKALDALDDLPDTDEPDAEKDAKSSSGAPVSAQPSAADKFKEKAAGFAGLMKEKAGKLSDDLKESAEKKKQAKKKAKQRTIEEELADLAEEEKHFDEWGRPIRKKKKHRRRKKGRGLSCTLVLLTAILATSSVLSVAILAIAKEMYGIDKDVDDRIINIPEGATTLSIATQLQDEHMISLPQVFRLVSRMNGKDGQYIAGEHILAPSMSYQAMIEELCKNHADERESMRVLINEGMRLVDVATRLQENQICDAEDFLFYFNRGGYGFKFESYLPEKNALKWQQREGYCFPDTYEFYVDEDPNIVAQKIYAHFDSKLSDGDYEKMDELGLSLDQVITLASMVQAEAGEVQYMKKIAAVFFNRMHSNGMFPKFESDPTSKYAKLINENLEIGNDPMTTAYDTYKSAGLPPGAINNPGKDAIEAVLYPDPDTTIFFFNANIDTKVTYFSHTLDEHNANLQKVQDQYAAAKAAANGET